MERDISRKLKKMQNTMRVLFSNVLNAFHTTATQ